MNRERPRAEGGPGAKCNADNENAMLGYDSVGYIFSGQCRLQTPHTVTDLIYELINGFLILLNIAGISSFAACI